MWCIHIFSKGFFASLIYKDKTMKSLKLDPSKLKLTGNRKTGPDLTIYKFWWIFFSFPVPTFHSLFACVYCVFVNDDESGSQHLSLRETSSPCVGQHSKENKQIQSSASSLFLLSSTVPSSMQRRCTLYDLLASSPSILFLLVLLYAFWLPQGWEENVPAAAESPEDTKS